VPCTTVVRSFLSRGTNFEIPKSETFAVKLSSSSMFEGLTSLWIIGGEAVECRYDSASAVSTAILRQVSQCLVDALLS
jgi:hypothetical protein